MGNIFVYTSTEFSQDLPMNEKRTSNFIRAAAVLLILLLLLPTAAFTAHAATDYSGDCGDDAVWVYDPDTATLTISGTGPMWDLHYGTCKYPPWRQFRSKIKKVVIDYGITATGRYAFCCLDVMEELEFVTKNGLTSVETIGGHGFCWSNALQTLVLPEGVRYIGGRAFSRVESLKTVYLPSTLEAVDMYAFESLDSKITISTVYYNGTKEAWDSNVYVSTQGDNAQQLLPDADTQWFYLQEPEVFEDLPADSKLYYTAAAYYLKGRDMLPDVSTFDAMEKATAQWVAQILYFHAGASGAYTGPMDWAVTQNILNRNTAPNTTLRLLDLAEILYRMTCYNGIAVDLDEKTALDWCRSAEYIPSQLSLLPASATLSRGQAAVILATYLQSRNGTAKRYDDMCRQIKTAYEAGGDGKMYILALHHSGTGKIGDCTLILMPGGELMLIDTFRDDGWKDTLKSTLDAVGAKHLDYLVLSHGHSDHAGSVSNVIKYIYNKGYTIGNYWSAGATTSLKEQAAIAQLTLKGDTNIISDLRRGKRLTIGTGSNTVKVDILWPSKKGYTGDSNNGSMAMKLTYGQSSYLTGGDLYMDAEEQILEFYQDTPEKLQADVIKANHHGGYSSNSSQWIDTVDPRIIIANSDDNGDSTLCYRYCLDGRAWFSSGRDGGVLVVMDDQENISVITGYDSDLRQELVSCGATGHDFTEQSWIYGGNKRWKQCRNYWLCGVIGQIEERGTNFTESTEAISNG